VAEWPKALVC